MRVSDYTTDGLLCFEYDPGQPLSTFRMRALPELETHHGPRLYDEVKEGMAEAIRPQWAMQSSRRNPKQNRQ